MAEAALSFTNLGEHPLSLATKELEVMSGLREGGLDEDHVERLVEGGGTWPAILVWAARPVVLDGAHRLAAARRLGMGTIPAVRFCGSWQEAYVEAVRRNIAHGLPLTLRERTAAARRVLETCPEWSDRRISLVCGLSAKTVAKLRRDACWSGDVASADVRVGRDGRVRPVEAKGVRERIARALAEQPSSSLRAIATQVGASPETVRSVRTGLGRAQQDGPDPLPEPAVRMLSLVAPQPDRPSWNQDSALSSTPCSGAFLKWFGRTEVAEEWVGHVAAVPLSRVYEISDEARRRARAWQDFAEALEDRVRRRESSK